MPVVYIRLHTFMKAFPNFMEFKIIFLQIVFIHFCCLLGNSILYIFEKENQEQYVANKWQQHLIHFFWLKMHVRCTLNFIESFECLLHVLW